LISLLLQNKPYQKIRIMSVSTVTRYLLIGIVFPFLMQYVAYYRFTGNYLPNVFSEKSFTEFYENSVFRYRILGRELQIWTYHQLKAKNFSRHVGEMEVYSRRLDVMDPNADKVFYFAYFILNTTFTILTALGLLYLFDRKSLYHLNERQKIFATSFLTLIICITQFVVTPYDVLAYFLEVLAFTVFVSYMQSNKWYTMVAFCALVSIATLARESSALILSFGAALYFTMYGFQMWWIKKLVLPTMCFIITYAGLRLMYINEPIAIAEKFTLFKNVDFSHPASYAGIMMTVVVFYLMVKATTSQMSKKLMMNYILMTLPYIIVLPFIGLLIEFRLWVPLLIGSLMLVNINLKALYVPGKQRESSKHPFMPNAPNVISTT